MITGVIDKFERKKKPSRYALPLRAEEEEGIGVRFITSHIIFRS